MLLVSKRSLDYNVVRGDLRQINEFNVIKNHNCIKIFLIRSKKYAIKNYEK